MQGARGTTTARGRAAAAALVVVALAAASFAGPRPAAATTAAAAPLCAAPMPFEGIAGAHLEASVHQIRDTQVSYLLYRGFVPSFDGLPLSVDVTVPCQTDGPVPAVVMAHGFTDDKTVWEETGKSDSVRSVDRPGSNSHWNNVWFVSRGYAVLTYTARGWRDSCGPDTPGMSAASPAPQCAGHQYWIHLDDKRWEVRDAQWLAGGLVQSGTADRRRLAITGGSYGGGPASMAGLLGDRVMCGADPVPRELGPDPCAGKRDGALARWTTPDGRTRLRWAAALPLYTFGDLIQVLAPNGRGTDRWSEAPRNGNHSVPFGVPLESTVSGLILAAGAFGSLAPPGTDPSSDIATSTARLLAGNPFPADDPEVQRGIREYRTFKSPLTISPARRVPIFWVQGFTDALFPGSEALTVRAHVLAMDPGYPFKLFLGDIGHDYAAERTDEWALVKDQMNAFLDHYLRPDRTPRRPSFDVGATVTRCLTPDEPLRYVHARTWHALHPRHTTFTSRRTGRTSTAEQGPAGVATDPISTATLGGPASYKGCRTMRPSEPDPTVATYRFTIRRDDVLLGGPVVDVRFDATGPDVPLSVRVWDVAPDDAVQGLITRGTYRVAGEGTGLRARFQLAPQGYQLRAGHRLKVEVTANDSPYLQASTIPATVTVRRLSITLPLR